MNPPHNGCTINQYQKKKNRMDNFQKAVLLFFELKKDVKIENKDDRLYLESLKLTLYKIDEKEKNNL